MRKVLCVSLVIGVLLVSLSPVSGADEPWLGEFESICEATSYSSELSVEELQALVERADKLLAEIEAGDAPSKKMYIFRTKKCRNFFVYMIELKQRGPAEKDW